MAPQTAKEVLYEFGGPLGAALISFGLPVACYAFAFLCNDISGCPAPALLSPSTFTLAKLKAEVAWPGLFGLINLPSLAATLGYYGFSLLLYRVLPSHEVEGTVLKRSGKKLRYRFNGFSSAILTLMLLAFGTFLNGPNFGAWTFINNNYIQIMTANILISYALATYVYVRSFTVPHKGEGTTRELAHGGATGNIIYDWYIGRELNPQVQIPFIGAIDIKSWCELRPGMLGWIILDVAFIMKQWSTFGYVTDSILLVTYAQSFYFFDALYNEPAILSTMDIITDGFGFMLAFGDLVWVPFIYSLQARYLSVHAIQLGGVKVAVILAVQFIGYYIFRASNSQKGTFRANPDDPRVRHLTFIKTSSGSKLITSGWWGAARHINYFGDWLMSWSFCLPTWASGYVVRQSILTGESVITQGSANEYMGWAIPITYFYMLYFAILLIHRERRDDENCHRKYGKDWEEYRRLVKWRIIPGVY